MLRHVADHHFESVTGQEGVPPLGHANQQQAEHQKTYRLMASFSFAQT